MALPNLKETFSIGPPGYAKLGIPRQRFTLKPVGLPESLVSALFWINSIQLKDNYFIFILFHSLNITEIGGMFQ